MKKFFGGHKWGNPNFWGIFEHFCSHPLIQSLEFSKFSHLNQNHHYLTHCKIGILGKKFSGCLLGTRPHFETFIFIYHFCIFLLYDGSNEAVWTTWNLDRLYCRYRYLKIEIDFSNYFNEGRLISIIRYFMRFFIFSPVLKKSSTN